MKYPTRKCMGCGVMKSNMVDEFYCEECSKLPQPPYPWCFRHLRDKCAKSGECQRQFEKGGINCGN